MEALVVVLDDELPVRLQLVRVRCADDQPLGLVIGDPFVEAGEEHRQRWRVAGRVDHHPAVPFLDGDGDQRVLRLVEPVRGIEPRRRQQ